MQVSVLEIKEENYNLRSNYLFINSLNQRGPYHVPKYANQILIEQETKEVVPVLWSTFLCERKMKLNILLCFCTEQKRVQVVFTFNKNKISVGVFSLFLRSLSLY